MNIFTYIKGKLSNDLYIQVWESRIKVGSIQTRVIYEQEPLVALESKTNGEKVVVAVGNSCKKLNSEQYEIINPFSHPRVLLKDFLIAEKLIQHAIREVHKSRFFAPAPRVIFHPMEKTEGGLSTVEDRAFRELCFGAGAREILVYIGSGMSLYSLDFDKVKQELLHTQ